MASMRLPIFNDVTGATVPRAFAVDAQHAQLVHLVRHGEGEHNVACALSGPSCYKNEVLRDAPLTAAGRAQARALGERMRATGATAELIYVSPMLRTLQTAEILIDAAGMGAAPVYAFEELREACG
jgi:broad specificity phosphatase PhoE